MILILLLNIVHGFVIIHSKYKIIPQNDYSVLNISLNKNHIYINPF